MFSILTVQNDIKLSLLSVHIDPSTTLLLSFVLAGYFYAVHVRSHPLPRAPIAHFELPEHEYQWQVGAAQDYEHDLGAAGHLRRASIFRRLTGGFRGRKRDRVVAPAPAETQARLALPAPIRAHDRKNGRRTPVSQSPLRLSLRGAFGFGGGREKAGEQRRILPARVEENKGRKKLRLLE